MDRQELRQYILENYNSTCDNPFIRYPDIEVFRHVNDKKGFAVVMNVSKRKLGLDASVS